MNNQKFIVFTCSCSRPKGVSLHVKPKEWWPYQAKQKPARRPGFHQRALSLGETRPWTAAQHYCAFAGGQLKKFFIRISSSFLYFRIKPTMNTQRISALSFIILPEKNLNRRVRQSRISGILAISTTNIQRNYILTQIKVRTAKFLLEFYCISTISLLTVSY